MPREVIRPIQSVLGFAFVAFFGGPSQERHECLSGSFLRLAIKRL